MDTIKAVLVGNDREEHVFALTQSLELYGFYKAQIAARDRRLEAAVGVLTVWADDDLAPLPKARIGKHKEVTFKARTIAVLFYNAIRYGMTYQDQGAAAYDKQRHRQRVLSNLQHRAKTLGYISTRSIIHEGGTRR